MPVKPGRRAPLKSGRRLPLRTGRRDWLWAVALVTVVLVVLFAAFVAIKGGSVKTYATVDGVDCQTGERLEYHIHAALEILNDGAPVTVPKNTGIRSDCLVWLHTHADPGL